MLDVYEIIILDCDGVVFDSNYLKLKAFRNVLSEYDIKIVDGFIKYFKNNFGTSRYNLIKVFIEEFMEIDLDVRLYNDILKKYSEQCILLYQNAPLTNMCLEFLEHYKEKQLYIASGSDEKELKNVFFKRELSGYFNGILGSPESKVNNVEKIISSNKNAIFIGDAKSDLIAARKNNVDFIFMKDYSTSEEMMNNTSIKSINNLRDLIE